MRNQEFLLAISGDGKSFHQSIWAKDKDAARKIADKIVRAKNFPIGSTVHVGLYGPDSVLYDDEAEEIVYLKSEIKRLEAELSEFSCG